MTVNGDLGKYDIFSHYMNEQFVLPVADKDFINAVEELSKNEPIDPPFKGGSWCTYDNGKIIYDDRGVEIPNKFLFHLPVTKSKWFPMINELYKRGKLDNKKLIKE